MITKKILILNILIGIILISSIQVFGNQNIDTTTLEIVDIRGGFCRITADIKNTGNVDAKNFSITLSVKGGLLNSINISHECSGCGHCGTIIPADGIKTESTRESGLILGFGRIAIIVTAEAENADLVTEEVDGFVLGPICLII
jgi:hypothetical protein